MTDQTIDPPRLSDKLTGWLNRPTGVALTAFLALSCAMVKFLTYNQYPILSPEIGLIGLFIALLSVGFGLAYRYTKWLALGLLIVFLGLALVVMISSSVDSNPNFLSGEFGILGALTGALVVGLRITYKYQVRLGHSIVVILLATAFFEFTTTSPWSVIGVLVAFLITRRRFLPIAAVFSFTFLATTPLITLLENVSPQSAEIDATDGPPAPRWALAQPNGDKPFILHLILDEHLGIEGFNSFTLNPQSIRDSLLDFYGRHGFQVFGGAYSKHFHTKNSMPDILRLGADAVDPETPKPENPIDRLAYLKEIEARGYPLSVLQSNEIQYCSSTQILACVTYSANGPLSVVESSLSPQEKAKFILSGFLTLSPSVTQLATLYDYAALLLRSKGIEIPFLFIKLRSSTHPIMGLEILEKKTGDLAQSEPGTAHFAHILLPHFPYVYDKACTLKAFDDWRYRWGGDVNFPIAEREAAYVEQIRCSLLQLDLVLAALDKSPARDNYVVIIHGDHGSRITEVDPTAENVGKFSDRDLIAGFSTLFAVRYPDPRPGYVADHISVDKLLKNLLENDFQAIHADDIENGALTVVLDNQDWVPTLEYNLPRKWPAPTGSQ